MANRQFVYRILRLASERASHSHPKPTGVGAASTSQPISRDYNSSSTAQCEGDHELVNIKGMIFDMDGTLTLPVYDSRELKKRLAFPENTLDILSTVSKLPDPQKSEAICTIEQYEEEVRNQTSLQPHVSELLLFSGVNAQLALLTRNSDKGTKHFLHLLQTGGDEAVASKVASGSLFSQIVTRDFLPTKPDPAPVQHICSQWGIPPHCSLLVGDDWKDIMCGNKAGSVTVLLRNDNNHDHPLMAKPHFIVDSLTEIVSLLQSPFTVEVKE